MPSVDDILGPPKPRERWADPKKVISSAVPGARFTSGTRTPAENRRVGGSRTSSHVSGDATDFVPPDGDTSAAARKLVASGVPYDQIIDEGDHVHVGYDPRMRGQVLGKGRPAPKLSVDDILGPPPKPKVDDILGPPPKAAAKPAPARAAAAPAVKAPNPFENFLTDYRARVDRAGAAIKEGLEPSVGAADPISTGKKILGVAGGVFSALASPVTAATDTAVGRPAETLSGGRYPKENAGDIVEQVGGFLVPGAPKGAKPSLAGEAFTPFKATRTEKALAKTEATAQRTLPTVDEVLGDAPQVQRAKVAPVAPAVAEAIAPATGKPTKVKEIAAATEDPLDDILYAPGKGPTRLKPGVFPEEPPVKGAIDHALDGAKAVQKILAPATVGLGREGSAVLRRASSEADLQAAQAAAKLTEHTRRVEALDVPAQRELVAYIEGRSTGAKLADPELQKTADDIRSVYEGYRNRIGQVVGEEDGPSFISDYYTHMWKEAPNLVVQRMNARQGSGRNLKARTIPTLQEGIEAGLTPKSENPLEVTMNYTTNMSRYLATVDAQADLTAQGYAKFHKVGQQPAGWVPLEGIRTTKGAKVIVQDGETVANQLEQKLYAPEDVARVYNNWISKGWEAGDVAPLAEGARKVSNGMVMLKLGLSPFHAMTMVQESILTPMSQGIQNISRAPALAAKGKLGEAGALAAKGAGQFASGSIPGVGFVKELWDGNARRAEMLGIKDAKTAEQITRNEAYVAAGGRVKMDDLYRARGAGSFYNAIQRGTLKREVKESVRRIFGKGGIRATDRAMGVADLTANLIQSTSAPLFEYTIPRLKLGAFDSTMADWMKANPAATGDEIADAAHLINRSIENRFGEMAWDNLFWDQRLKQASRLALLSPTWNIGTINEIGGGLVDLLGPSAKGVLSGQGVSTRSAYVAAMVFQVAMVNGIMTYLKTGEMPEGMDFLVYRTGGVDARNGEPERALFPGSQKDVFAYSHDFPNHVGQEIGNKMNPALKTAIELSTNKDFRGLPIWPQDGAMPGPNDRGLGDYLLEQFAPISVNAAIKGQKKGSNITPLEQNLAIRSAPSYMVAPEKQERYKETRNRRAWERKRKADNRAKNMQRED